MITETSCLTCLSDDSTMYVVDDLDELRGVWCGSCDVITWADEIREYNSTATWTAPEALRP